MVGSPINRIHRFLIKSMGALGPCALVFWMVQSVGAYAPSLRWKTLQTEHFSVHYTPDSSEEAQKTGVIAEEAFQTITPVFGWTPRGRIQITLVDEYDLANGSATPFPYNAINIYLPSPDPNGQLGEVNDWLRLVLTHELVHIVHLDMARGGPRVLRSLMGKNPLGLFPLFPSTMPNLSSPLWIIEGYATLYESRLTGSGRMKGHFFDMMLRCDVLENDFLSLPQMTSWQTTWPGGIIRYLYGSSFLDYVTTRLGPDSTARLNDVQSRQLFPAWRVNAGLIPYGKNYEDLYFQWKKSLKDKYKDQLRHLQEEPITQTTPLTKVGYGVSNPRFSPQRDRVAYLEESPHRASGLRIREMPSGEDRLAVEGIIEGSLDWSPDGRQIVFSMLRFSGAYRLRKDLYVYDTAQKKSRRLTRGERAKDPTWNPQGGSLVYVRIKPGGEDVVLMDLATRERQVLLSGKPGERWSSPQWDPTGSRLLLSHAAPGETFDIVCFDPTTGTWETWVKDPGLDLTPVWSPGGQGFYFVSDRTGVFNIYHRNIQNGLTRRITNTVGGVFSPAPSPDGKEIVMVEYSHRGFDLSSLSLVNPFPHNVLNDAPLLTTATLTTPPSTASLHPKPYFPGQTLLPRFWSPNFEGGIFTAGVDALGENAYSAFTFIGSDHLVNWTNQNFYPLLSLDLWDLRRTVPLEGRGYAATAELPLRGILSSAALLVGVEKRDLDMERIVREERRSPPDVVPHQFGFTAEGVYSNARMYGFSVYPERGRSLSIHSYRQGPISGQSERFTTLRSSWQEYWPGFGRHHSVSVGWMGGTSNTAAFDSSLDAFFWNRANSLSRKLMRQKAGFSNDANGTAPLERASFVPPIEKDDRGFSKRFSQVHFSYRFPLGYPENGPGMGFMFLDRIYGHVFVLADRYSRSWEEPKTRTFIGTEVASWWGMGYLIPLTIGVSVQKQTSSSEPVSAHLRVEFDFR